MQQKPEIPNWRSYVFITIVLLTGLVAAGYLLYFVIGLFIELAAFFS